jgi:hypothetical protein
LPKPIQEQFGQTIIDAFAGFARADLENVAALEARLFHHVSNAPLKRRLAETLYGARWIYKLGLALLVANEEQMAHVRSQILDYGAVCEGLLHDMIDHALRVGMTGTRYTYKNPRLLTGPYPTTPTQITNQSFFWMIEVAKDEHIINHNLYLALDRLRLERNTVHVHARGYRAFLNTSRWAFGLVERVARQTQGWKAANP